MTMRCEDFDRWLDEGRPEPGGPPARDHAAGCPRCAAAMAAALDVDALLAAAPAPAPAGLVEGVMARVEIARRAAAAAQPEPPALDWWVRAAAEPSAALAIVLAGLLAWSWDSLPAYALGGVAWLGDALAGLLAPARLALPAASGSVLPAALLLALFSLMPWTVWLLYRWSLAATLRPGRRRVS